jgi:hypothetical protein
VAKHHGGRLTMTDIATRTDQPPDKQRRVSAKVRNAITAMVAGDVKTVTDAAEKGDLSREQGLDLAKALLSPPAATTKISRRRLATQRPAVSQHRGTNYLQSV